MENINTYLKNNLLNKAIGKASNIRSFINQEVNKLEEKEGQKSQTMISDTKSFDELKEVFSLTLLDVFELKEKIKEKFHLDKYENSYDIIKSFLDRNIVLSDIMLKYNIIYTNLYNKASMDIKMYNDDIDKSEKDTSKIDYLDYMKIGESYYPDIEKIYKELNDTTISFAQKAVLKDDMEEANIFIRSFDAFVSKITKDISQCTSVTLNNYRKIIEANSVHFEKKQENINNNIYYLDMLVKDEDKINKLIKELLLKDNESLVKSLSNDQLDKTINNSKITLMKELLELDNKL